MKNKKLRATMGILNINVGLYVKKIQE